MGFVQDPKKKEKEKSSHLKEKKKLSVFASVSPMNFDIFKIGRKKKSFFNLVPL